jgi:pimeloyl-ACP methyl ester carboxylesterase
MHGNGKLFSEFISMMPEPKHLEALYYPADVRLSYDQLLELVQSFVPESDPYFLLAESFSTPLAIQFASTNPQNLKGLILCAGFAASPVAGARRFLVALLAPMLFRLPISSIALEYFFIGPNASQSLKQSVRAAVSSVRPHVLSARLRAVLACDVRTDLSKIAVPILYIRATRDRLVHRNCMEEIQAILPQTAVVEVDGPHLVLQREPKRSAEIVARFMDESL